MLNPGSKCARLVQTWRAEDWPPICQRREKIKNDTKINFTFFNRGLSDLYGLTGWVENQKLFVSFVRQLMQFKSTVYLFTLAYIYCCHPGCANSRTRIAGEGRDSWKQASMWHQGSDFQSSNFSALPQLHSTHTHVHSSLCIFTLLILRSWHRLYRSLQTTNAFPLIDWICVFRCVWEEATYHSNFSPVTHILTPAH